MRIRAGLYLPIITLVALAAILGAINFTGGGLAMANASAQSAYEAPGPEDFSGFSWSDAFDKLHGKFSREYAFTEWKKVDWAALYKTYKPRIEQAQAANDFTAYYLALREYVHCIPDGHVRINSLQDIDNKYIGGSFGFSLAKLADGKVIATWVDETSAAYAQGVRAGAELVEWGGQPIDAALEIVSPLFAANVATAEDLANQKVRYLARAPVDTRITFAFLNESGATLRATVAAFADNGKSLTKIYPAAVVSDGLRDLILNVENPQNPPASMVETRLLAGNIGYIKLWGEFDADLENTGKAPSTLGLYKTALAEFKKAKVKGVIIDIRNNVGGLDAMVADMLAPFYPEKTLYEYQNCFNAATRLWEICPADGQTDSAGDPGLYIKPAAPFFSGPVVALVNSKCISSGEGLAMGIKNLPQGATVGFYGTNGSFGMAGGEAKMPGNLTVNWPYGQSLDKNKQVQLDSREGVGGIEPSVRTPMNKQNALRVARGEDVELEHAIAVIESYAR